MTVMVSPSWRKKPPKRASPAPLRISNQRFRVRNVETKDFFEVRFFRAMGKEGNRARVAVGLCPMVWPFWGKAKVVWGKKDLLARQKMPLMRHFGHFPFFELR